MDASKFDQLIRHLGTTPVTRLAALRGLAVGALAATIGLADPDDAAAKGRNCGQCKKAACNKKNGKRRCRCKKKANGTSCSIAGVPLAVCSDGSCVASATPVPVPPGFTCTPNTETGCTGGQVCNTAGNACVACTSFTQCNGQRVCIDGVCRGDEACGGPGGFECTVPFKCRDIPGSNVDRCYINGDCDFPASPPCPTDTFCRLGECVQPCAAAAPICPTGEECFSGLCIVPA